MGLIKTIFVLVAIISCVACQSGNSTSGSSYPNAGLTNGPTLPLLTGPNVMAMTIDGTNCPASPNINMPCVSVTVCSYNNSSNCVTIPGILLDTGSYGLRLFKTELTTLTLSPLTTGSETISECVDYGDGSSDWGPVEYANVQLGTETPVLVPIQVLEYNYSGNTSTNQYPYCGSTYQPPDQSPASAGFNGILGVGLFASDCGSECATDSNNQQYYACNGSSCTGVTVQEPQQVSNPVASLPADNNGVIVELPSIPLGGVPSTSGYVVLGIGTESNNQPGSVRTFGADPSAGLFYSQFNGATPDAFLDTGSNGIYFLATNQTPDCGNQIPNDQGFYCPTSDLGYLANIIGISGSPGVSVNFTVGNGIDLFNSGNNVFVELTGEAIDDNNGAMFDWGLPFFMGRNVYVGIEGYSSSLGSGPYWSF